MSLVYKRLNVLQGDTIYVYNLLRLHISNTNRSNKRKWLHTKKKGQEAENILSKL